MIGDLSWSCLLDHRVQKECAMHLCEQRDTTLTSMTESTRMPTYGPHVKCCIILQEDRALCMMFNMRNIWEQGRGGCSTSLEMWRMTSNAHWIICRQSVSVEKCCMIQYIRYHIELWIAPQAWHSLTAALYEKWIKNTIADHLIISSSVSFANDNANHPVRADNDDMVKK